MIYYSKASGLIQPFSQAHHAASPLIDHAVWVFKLNQVPHNTFSLEHHQHVGACDV